jgi:hypothetical protein
MVMTKSQALLLVGVYVVGATLGWTIVGIVAALFVGAM